MLVHHHETRDHGLSGEVNHLRAVRYSGRPGGTERDDVAVADDQGLVFLGRRAGAVDDAHVGERDDRCVDRDVRLDGRRERRTLGRHDRGSEEQGAEGA